MLTNVHQCLPNLELFRKAKNAGINFGEKVSVAPVTPKVAEFVEI